ncbi:MAG: squalene synthase HpnC [Planctomycetaceae bacterium]|jgi:squalene synthase HpnC|nr:squalene synthase HpnC [Planctomycetaceae bacterium]
MRNIRPVQSTAVKKVRTFYSVFSPCFDVSFGSYSRNRYENPLLPTTLQEALRYCTASAKSHYENFHVATMLLPKTLRLPFYVVYTYCRCSDDIADEHDASAESRQAALQKLDAWQEQLDRCFDFAQELPVNVHRVFIALRKIAAEYQLPRQPFADLLVAFRRDQIHRHYATMNDLLGYCRYSAAPVGRIVLHLVCRPSEQQLSWSDSICTGLQLANFWQDVKRDSEIGRCYIPQDIARRYNVVTENLQDTLSFRTMILELTADARRRLQEGAPLVDSVPKNIRTDIRLFIEGGLAVLGAVEKIDGNVLTKRPVVSRWTKFRLLLRAAVMPSRPNSI